MWFNKNALRLYIRHLDYIDSDNKVTDVGESYRWSLDKLIHINNNEDFEYAKNIILQSYNNSNENS